MTAGLIILKILKVIGIILLSLLALLLLLLCVVLFVPVRYKAEAHFHDRLAAASVRIRYLFPLVNVCFDLGQSRSGEETQTEMSGGVRIFGIRIINFFPTEEEKAKIAEKKAAAERRKAEKEKKRRKNKKNRDTEETAPNGEVSEPLEDSRDEAALGKVKADSFEKSERADETDGFEGTGGAEGTDGFEGFEGFGDTAEADEDNEEYGRIEKIRLFLLKLGDIFSDVYDKLLKGLDFLTNLPDDVNARLDAFREQLCQLKKKLRRAVKLWEKPQTQEAFRKAKKAIFKILKAIRPRKGYLKAHLGFDDIATTGQIAGYYGMAIGMFYPLVGRTITLQPDFEQNIMEGDLMLKGHIRLCIFLRVLWLYLFDKDIRYLKKALKKGGFV